MRHEWTAVLYLGTISQMTVEADGTRVRFYQDGEERYSSTECEIDEDALGAEILHLAGRVRGLEADLAETKKGALAIANSFHELGRENDALRRNPETLRSLEAERTLRDERDRARRELWEISAKVCALWDAMHPETDGDAYPPAAEMLKTATAHFDSASRIAELEKAAEQERKSCALQHKRANALERRVRELEEHLAEIQED
jgi:hypothetical protein